MVKGRIHSYETLGGLDGPGLRTVVFLQGCPLRCGYCHNPDTWNPAAGHESTVEEVMGRIQRYRPYYGKEGGVTLSGGEPLVQAEFVAELCEACAREGIHSAIDTAGFPLSEPVERALRACDLLLLDIKHADPARFRWLTGANGLGMRDVLAFAKANRRPAWVRQVIVPGWNDSPQDIATLAAMLEDFPSCERAELLPYHRMGQAKWQSIGAVSPFADTPPMDPAALAELQRQLDRALAAARP